MLAAVLVVLSYDTWKQSEAVAALLLEWVGTASILVFCLPPNSRLVLDEKRPTKEQEAQRNNFDDVPCDSSLFHQWLHAELLLGAQRRSGNTAPHHNGRQLVETLSLPQSGDTPNNQTDDVAQRAQAGPPRWSGLLLAAPGRSPGEEWKPGRG